MYQHTILPKWSGFNESGNIAILDVQIASFMCFSCYLLKHYPNLNKHREAKLKLLKTWAQNLFG